MKLDEFKAWFEGFAESMEASPTKKQWERIKARVAEIDGTPISYPVYVDRYVRPYAPYWSAGGCWNSPSVFLGQAQNSAGYVAVSNTVQNDAAQFDGVNAMYVAGKAEAGASAE